MFQTTNQYWVHTTWHITSYNNGMFIVIVKAVLRGDVVTLFLDCSTCRTPPLNQWDSIKKKISELKKDHHHFKKQTKTLKSKIWRFFLQKKQEASKSVQPGSHPWTNPHVPACPTRSLDSERSISDPHWGPTRSALRSIWLAATKEDTTNSPTRACPSSTHSCEA